MDIPNLSKYLVFEDGRLWAKNRGMMLNGSRNRFGEISYYVSFDNNIDKFFKIRKTKLERMYNAELDKSNFKPT